MHLIAEIWHFFEIYEALEPGKSWAGTRGWERRREGILALEDARRRFAEHSAVASRSPS
jgi:inorganic pyrophosphatase